MFEANCSRQMGQHPIKGIESQMQLVLKMQKYICLLHAVALSIFTTEGVLFSLEFELLWVWCHVGLLFTNGEQEMLLKIPKRKLRSFTQHSFSFLAPSLWNSLPATLRNVPTLSQFQSHLKTFLFAQAFQQYLVL